MAGSWERTLTGAVYLYLFVDARYEHPAVRAGGEPAELPVSTMHNGGQPENLAVEAADTETAAPDRDLVHRRKAGGRRICG